MTQFQAQNRAVHARAETTSSTGAGAGPAPTVRPAPTTPSNAPVPQARPSSGQVAKHDPNPSSHIKVEGTTLGRIVAVTGSRAQVLLTKPDVLNGDQAGQSPFIGTLLTVQTPSAIVLCLIHSMAVPQSSIDQNSTDVRLLDVDLVGELRKNADGYVNTFKRGVSIYPRIGEPVQTATTDVLKKVFKYGEFEAVEVGVLHQDPSIPAIIRVDEMLGKHFAIVGSTGSGKSCAVALILRQVLARHANAHIVLLDPHNEYGNCFGDKTERVQIENLELPFWILTFEEIVEVLLGDAKKHADEVEILRDLIPVAKRQFSNGSSRAASLKSRAENGSTERFSVDVPVPYRMSDMLALLDSEMGRLEKTKAVGVFKSLKARIETVMQDPRYAFMFGNFAVQDNLIEVIKRLFRIPVNGKPITVIQMMGLPAEVVNVMVSVLARLVFDVTMWSEGRIAITLVCEEAHRYVPRSESIGFEPTKRAISRIAKEGRKYGASLCVVSQRPGDIDPTILSQCSTLFTMRLSNEHDQQIVGSALADASASLLDFLPALGIREAIVFGEGVTLPSRILLKELPQDALPRGNTAPFAEAWAEDITDGRILEKMVSKWRMSNDLMRNQQVDHELGGWREPGLNMQTPGVVGSTPSLTREPAGPPSDLLREPLEQQMASAVSPEGVPSLRKTAPSPERAPTAARPVQSQAAVMPSSQPAGPLSAPPTGSPAQSLRRPEPTDGALQSAQAAERPAVANRASDALVSRMKKLGW